MSTIKIENLNFSYYGYVNPVFENVSFSFDTNWKIGLIGRNGIGKSTLFKLLLNQETYQGKISQDVDFIKFPPNLSDTSKLGIILIQSSCLIQLSKHTSTLSLSVLSDASIIGYT